MISGSGRPRPLNSFAEVQRWLSDEDLQCIYTYEYWNDINEERKKEWWIEDGDYDKCLRFLDRSNLLREYLQAQTYVEEMRSTQLKIADLAAGTGWTSALLSKVERVSEVHAVDISSHRLERLFPHSVKMLEGRPDKIRRYLGSFYDLRLPAQSMDVVFLSQAFHHADRPIDLMIECDRVLKQGGRIVLVGEHGIGTRRIVKRFLKTLLTKRKLLTSFRELFPPDPVLGDHYYLRSDYYFLFAAFGYAAKHRIASTGQTIFVGDKPISAM